jgi:hypothetical protein
MLGYYLGTSINAISGNSYYVGGVFSIGAYIKNNSVTLIDSGSDDRYAKNLYKLKESQTYS